MLIQALFFPPPITQENKVVNKNWVVINEIIYLNQQEWVPEV
jgi:hypothetical protein